MEYNVGDIILRYYKVVEVLKGGFGIVYMCTTTGGQMVAVKSFQDKYFYREDRIADRVVRDFYHEAEVWVRLEKHRNIVKAKFVFEVVGKPHIFLEYVDGGNLRDWITNKHLDTSRLLDLAIQFCDGMIYANSKDLGEGRRGIVHRDVKPENIMMTSKGELKITDFGLVKALGFSTAERPTGTPEYMSPEQFETMNVDARSDIYSFGVVLYEMLSGRPPFYIKTEDSSERWMFCKHNHQEVSPKPLRMINPIVPERLERVVMRCLMKKPCDRFKNFGMLRRELLNMYRRFFGDRLEVRERIQTLNAEEMADKGLSLMELGRYGEAVRCFNVALRMKPSLDWVWDNKGLAYARSGRYEEAFRCFDMAIRINPKNAKAWNNKGNYLHKAFRYREAITCFKNALKLNPSFGEAMVNLSRPLMRLKRYDEALECCDKALQMNPTLHLAWCNEGVILLILNRGREALECFDRALEINPRDSVVLTNKAVALYSLGCSSEAVKCLDRVLAMNPRDWWALCDKGEILAELGEYDCSIRCFAKAVEIAAMSGQLRALRNVLDRLTKIVEVLAKAEKFEEAVRCLDLILKVELRDKLSREVECFAWYNKAVLLMRIGFKTRDTRRIRAALSCVDKALRIDPGFEMAKKLKYDLKRMFKI